MADTFIPPWSPYYYGSGGMAPGWSAPPAPPRVQTPSSANSPYYYGSGGRRPVPPKRPASTLPGIPKPPLVVDPLTKLIESLYGQIESPAQQEARIQREIDAQIAAQKAMLDDEYARQAAQAQAMARAMSEAGAAAAGMSGDLFNAVGGEYNRAAREIQNLSHGLTGGAASATQANVDTTNAGLARVGAPDVLVGGAGGGMAGPGQAGVEEYRSGTLPGQLLTSAGQAETFGLAGMIGAQNLRATQEANAALMTSMREINDNQNKAVAALAAGRADLAHTYLNDAKDAQIKTISLIQGLTAQQAAGTTGTKPITQRVGSTLLQYNPATGQWSRVYQGATTAKAPVTKNVGGNLYTYDPKKNAWILTIRKPPSASAGKPVTQKVGGNLYQWNPTTRAWELQVKDTTKTGAKGKKLPTPGQTQKLVEQWFYGKDVATLKEQPNVDAQGNPVYRRVPGGKQGQLDYQAALRSLKALGYNEEQARGYLNPLYGRGDRGRPYVNAPQRAVLQKAGVPKNANVLPGFRQKNGKVTWQGPSKLIVAGLTPADRAKVTDRYLTPKQVEALQAAGMLPPGVWVPGSGLKDSRGASLARVYLISHLG